jgi:hypothetical protein
MSHVEACLKIEFCEIVAVCDLRDDRAKHAAKECEKAGAKAPAIYSGTEHIWEKMVERDDLMRFTWPRRGPGTFPWPWARWNTANMLSWKSRRR